MMDCTKVGLGRAVLTFLHKKREKQNSSFLPPFLPLSLILAAHNILEHKNRICKIKLGQGEIVDWHKVGKCPLFF